MYVCISVAQERDVERQRVDELLEMNMSLQVELKRHSRSDDVTRTLTHPHVLQSELESDEELQEFKSVQTLGKYTVHVCQPVTV